MDLGLGIRVGRFPGEQCGGHQRWGFSRNAPPIRARSPWENLL
jgi:hypothetical protein